MEIKRRQYTAEFKRDAVALVMEQGYTMTLAAQNLGVRPNCSHAGSANSSTIRMRPFPARDIKRPSQSNCAGYAKTISGYGWSATS